MSFQFALIHGHVCCRCNLFLRQLGDAFVTDGVSKYLPFSVNSHIRQHVPASPASHPYSLVENIHMQVIEISRSISHQPRSYCHSSQQILVRVTCSTFVIVVVPQCI